MTPKWKLSRLPLDASGAERRVQQGPSALARRGSPTEAVQIGPFRFAKLGGERQPEDEAW